MMQRPFSILFPLTLLTTVACGSDDSATGANPGTSTGGLVGASTGGQFGATGGQVGTGTGGQIVSGAGSQQGAGGTPSPGAGGSTPGTTGGASSAGGSGAGGVPASAGGSSGAGGSTAPLEHFSFFVTSLKALVQLSNSQSGFGGDLRFGETGDGAGLRGADKICSTIAGQSMPGAEAKQWRAFLSATAGGPSGGPVHAIDRVGEGPWYDRLGRLIAMNKTDLVQTRPRGADPLIIDDLPNEDGVPNHAPDLTAGQVDNHDTLTGSNEQGQLFGTEASTCKDWTSAVGADGQPRVGHSWPRSGGGFPGGGFPGGGVPGGGGGGPGGIGDMNNWMSALNEAGCAPGVSLIEMGPPNGANPTVGSGGGYGGFYCFALTP